MINNVDESVFYFDALSLIPSFNPTIKNNFNILIKEQDEKVIYSLYCFVI